MNLHVARRYLLIPICPNTKTEKVIFRHSQYDPEILYEMDLPIASELPVYHAALDLSAHMGEDIYVSLLPVDEIRAFRVSPMHISPLRIIWIVLKIHVVFLIFVD